MNTARNTTDQGLRHSELAADTLLRPAGGDELVHRLYVHDFRIRPYETPVPPTAALLVSVSSVIISRPKKQVVRSDAWRVVAPVEHAKVVRQGLVGQFEGVSVSEYSRALPGTEYPVAFSHLRSDPQPARLGLLDLAPESADRVLRRNDKATILACASPATFAKPSRDSGSTAGASVHQRSCS